MSDVVEEAHVEHAVGLVEDQRGEGVELQAAAGEVVEQPARRAHHHVGAVGEAVHLGADRAAAAQAEHLDVLLEAGEAADLLAHLLGQFAGRAQHHRLHREVARVEALQQRQAEGGGLAAARLGLGDEVVAGQGHRQAGGLDRRHQVVAEAGQVGEHRGGEAQLREGRRLDGGGRWDEGGVGRHVRRRGQSRGHGGLSPRRAAPAASLLRGVPQRCSSRRHCSRSRARRCWTRASSSACSRRAWYSRCWRSQLAFSLSTSSWRRSSLETWSA